MCEECVAPVKDGFGFFVDCSTDGEDLRVYGWVSEETRG